MITETQLIDFGRGSMQTISGVIFSSANRLLREERLNFSKMLDIVDTDALLLQIYSNTKNKGASRRYVITKKCHKEVMSYGGYVIMN